MSEQTIASDNQAEWFGQEFARVVDNVEKVIFGKRDVVRLSLVALFAQGHLLIEDVPGTGKTSLAKAIAQSIDGKWNRIQFTPDLLPADVTGSTVFHQSKGTFEFHPGPVFANIVLGDEINRASPKTQSALLEVMEEHQVTVDAHAYPVPRPFMVMATQNSIEFEGTYRLPEAQLDRFLMKIAIGYLSSAAEDDVLSRHGRLSEPIALSPVMSNSQVRTMMQIADLVHVEPSVRAYIIAIAQASRIMPEVRLGVSTRGCLSLMRAGRVKAMSDGRSFVSSDDIKEFMSPVLEHRLVLRADAEMRGVTAADLLQRIQTDLVPPRRRSA